MGEYWFWKLRQIARKMRPTRRLRFESLEDRRVLAPLADIINITPDPRTNAVGDVAITFTEPVTGVDTADFQLTRNLAVVSLTGLTVNGTGDSYTLNLATVTAIPGAYTLTLVAAGSGIIDANNEALADNASDSWGNSLVTADIIDVTPDPRNTAVGDVAINFSESVTGVNTTDFTLTRNGTAVSLAALTVNGSGASYTLNLSTVTATVGTYVFTLVATGSGITDADNNALSANASDTFVVEVTPPTADIVDITPDPRQTPVGVVTILFSESVTGVDIADFTLTRNGVAVSLAGLTVGGSGATYTLDLTTATAPFGSYVLTLVAANSGIKDLAGNALTANASDSWSIDDAQEDNDTLRTAKFLGKPNGPLTISSLGLVDSNDWYSFSLASKGGPNDKVAISFQNSQGDLDLQLYNVSGTKIKSSTGVTDGEQISLNGLAAGTYYIRVFGKNNAFNPNYSLTITVPVKLTDDLFEENDTRTAARALGTLTELKTVPNLVMADTHDWYRFITTSTGTGADFVQIDFLNSQGNLDLELYNASGTRLASSTGTTDNQNISLNGRAAGTYFVHVFGVGGVQNPAYTLTIDPPDPPPGSTTFDITLNMPGLTANQQAIVQAAALKWQSIITGELPNATYSATNSTPGIPVDDLLIDVTAIGIDGTSGTLAQSAPDRLRSVSFLPYHGFIQIDSTDLASLETNGTLLAVVEHEMAHVLGFGSNWSNKGLILGAGSTATGATGPRFIGANAIAAYNSIFGLTATSVPVENTGAAGTRDVHWRETTFGNELMTSALNAATSFPISRITVGSLADLGYTVNLAAADPYLPPASGVLAVTSGTGTSGGAANLIATSSSPIGSLPSPASKITVDLAAAALTAKQPAASASLITQRTNASAVDQLLADWLRLSNELTAQHQTV